MPAKRSDARYRRFVARHGDVAVELDALDPKGLEELVRTHVNEYFDELIYKDTLDAQKEARDMMLKKVEELLEGGDDEDEDDES